jgi:hypothetical protein
VSLSAFSSTGAGASANGPAYKKAGRTHKIKVVKIQDNTVEELVDGLLDGWTKWPVLALAMVIIRAEEVLEVVLE